MAREHEATVPVPHPDRRPRVSRRPASQSDRRPGRFLTPRAIAAIAALLVALLLSVAAAGEEVLPGDITLTQQIQRTDSPLGDALAAFGNWLGGTLGATVAGLLLGAVLLWRRAWWDAAFLAGAEGARAANHWLKLLIDSPRPTEGEVRILGAADGLGFPSGHAYTALLVGGATLVIANRRIGRPWLRRLASGLALAAILTIGYARVYSGAHWPTDVIGGYLWGFVLLVAVAILLDLLVIRRAAT